MIDNELVHQLILIDDELVYQLIIIDHELVYQLMMTVVYHLVMMASRVRDAVASSHENASRSALEGISVICKQSYGFNDRMLVLTVVDIIRVGSRVEGAHTCGNSLRGVPREQKMLKGHLPRVINHQVHWHTKSESVGNGGMFAPCAH